MILIILALSMLSTLSHSDPLYTFCPPEYGNYTKNSQFGKNINRLVGALSSNLTPNTSLPACFNTSIGDGADRVYVQALCRGDIDYTACRTCIDSASQEILNTCNTKDAIIWYEHCQIRYSFRMFFSIHAMDNHGKYPDRNEYEKDVTSNRDQFEKVLKDLMIKLTNETAYDPSKRMFATGEVKFSNKETIYGLSQCTRDMAQASCQNCLEQASGDLRSCCSSRQGGIVLGKSCSVRFQMYRFYNSTSKGNKWEIWKVLAIICTSTLVLAILFGFCAANLRSKMGLQGDDKSHHAFLKDLASSTVVTITQEGKLVCSEELQFMDINTLRLATDNFADSNKLGQGGFGTVYKGVLTDGKEVAVKRLERKSWQGLEELRNEVILIAKLQHRNVVRLLGCGIEGDEKLLLYEFMPNRSLDFFIFDSEKRSQLDWHTYYNIICGIARGLVYLHEDSMLKVIHRDLKPNNVLLDHEMVAKISDFGMARIFCENQNTANTKRVVGTYGYMAPEYAMQGLFSIKSDVFSFGVILLEIISGRKNNGVFLTEHAQTLLGYVWRLWKNGNVLECVDPMLIESSSPIEEILRCIHIGLLCVQEDPADRPTMSTVIGLLRNESLSRPEPRQPAVAMAWQLWNERRGMEMMDPVLVVDSSHEFLRYLHVGLLCVQEDGSDRPTMSPVVMLSSESTTLSQPKQPAFFMGKFVDDQSPGADSFSANGLTLSNVVPR